MILPKNRSKDTVATGQVRPQFLSSVHSFVALYGGNGHVLGPSWFTWMDPSIHSSVCLSILPGDFRVIEKGQNLESEEVGSNF